MNKNGIAKYVLRRRESHDLAVDSFVILAQLSDSLLHKCSKTIAYNYHRLFISFTDLYMFGQMFISFVCSSLR